MIFTQLVRVHLFLLLSNSALVFALELKQQESAEDKHYVRDQKSANERALVGILASRPKRKLQAVRKIVIENFEENTLEEDIDAMLRLAQVTPPEPGVFQKRKWEILQNKVEPELMVEPREAVRRVKLKIEELSEEPAVKKWDISSSKNEMETYLGSKLDLLFLKLSENKLKDSDKKSFRDQGYCSEHQAFSKKSCEDVCLAWFKHTAGAEKTLSSWERDTRKAFEEKT